MSGCFCTGACKNGGQCAASMNLNFDGIIPKRDCMPDHIRFQRFPGDDGENEAPGFHPLKQFQICDSSDHMPPSYLYLPPGMKYVHYCSSCGQKTVLYSTAPLAGLTGI